MAVVYLKLFIFMPGPFGTFVCILLLLSAKQGLQNPVPENCVIQCCGHSPMVVVIPELCSGLRSSQKSPGYLTMQQIDSIVVGRYCHPIRKWEHPLTHHPFYSIFYTT